jgi:glucosamine-6-phosphate deaminase
MEVVITKAPDEIGPLVADAITKALSSRPNPTLGLATGSSPLAVYRELIRRHKAEGLSFQNASAFLLDEYLGLPPDHPELYRTYIQRVFTQSIDLDPSRLHGPDVDSARPDRACADYEEQVKSAGGIDLQLLGIGTDGHIGFNEPSSSLGSRTRIKTLTRATTEDNARFFGGDISAVPKHVITMGIGTILEARHLVLVATGAAKAKCVAAAIEGPMTAMVPASALQLHPHVTIVLDDAAASELKLGDYYRETFASKPSWQGC